MTWINNQKGQDQEGVVVKLQKLGRGRPCFRMLTWEDNEGSPLVR